MKTKRETFRLVFVYALFILGLGLLQTTVLANVALLGASPDLLLILAILAGYMFGLEDGLAVGLAAGFLRDMLAGRALGLGMLLLMFAAIFAATLFRGLFRRNILLGLVQVVLMTVLYETFIMFLAYLIPMLPDTSIALKSLARMWLGDLPGHLLTNVIAAVPLVFLLHFAGPYRRGSRTDDTDEAIVRDSAWREI